MDAVSVVELKSEKCPRVCGADILELLAQKRSRSGRAKVLVVDVRTSEEYPFITIDYCYYFFISFLLDCKVMSDEY